MGLHNKPLKEQHIIFGDKARVKKCPDFFLGQDKVNTVRSVKHVGITLFDSFTHNEKNKIAITKAKSASFSLMPLGLATNLINPILSASLIHKICIPTLLYGSELWFNLSKQNIEQMEIFCRFCAKVMQGFDRSTRTDMCLSMLGWLPVQAEVDKRKLGFLQKLCSMPNDLLPKQVFNARLSMFIVRTDNKQKGYIPDIFKILKKYDMVHFIVNYIESSIFPSKLVWKKLVKRNIYKYESSQWLQRMRCQNVFDRFMSVHTVIKPAILWKCALNGLSLKNSRVVSKIRTDISPTVSRVCKFCESIYTDCYSHITTICPLTQSIRNIFFEHVHLKHGQHMFDKLLNGECEDVLRYLIGRYSNELDNEMCHGQFCQESYCYIASCVYLFETSQ